MSRLKPNQKITENKEYDYEDKLNWKDDGDELTDPSMNDYLKGYNIDPYEFKQWAKLKGLKKVAWTEIDVVEFSPKYLADKILKLFDANNGVLQDFYNAFTLRYPNTLKKAIADELKKSGYQVYPLLIEDKPIYAKNKNLMKKVAASKNLRKILSYSKFLFGLSKGIRSFIADVEQLDSDISLLDSSSLLSYYQQIFPDDYAVQLVKVMIDDPNNIDKIDDDKNMSKTFQDYDLSDDSLKVIEDYMSGNATPSYRRDGGFEGYDFTTDSRGYDSIPPNQYETRLCKKKQSKRVMM